ncbi:MAG: aldose epimerase family protein [Litoreibacter sp.]
MIFGIDSRGKTVEKLTLTAGNLSVGILTRGAILQDVRLQGIDRSLTLGSDNLADYEGALCHHGALVGPIANRINTAQIDLDGVTYPLERNHDGRVHLHSGVQGINRRNWKLVERSESHVTLACSLHDGACGLPGNRMITVTYRVTAPATLTMKIAATTDVITAMSCANHSYWNLDGTATWAGHRLQVKADRYLMGTDNCNPTGEIADVTGTPMDLRKARLVDPKIDSFNNNFCLSDVTEPLRDVLVLEGATGVKMTMATTAPGIQIYDNKSGARPGRRKFEGLALEAQCWPDAANNPSYPPITLRADDTYLQTTCWSFTA